MGRLVESQLVGKAAAASTTEEKAVSGLERIAKYVPIEVLAFYTMWTQGFGSIPGWDYHLEACVLGAVIGLLCTYFYFDRFFPNAPVEERTAHKLVSTVAFAVYAYTITGSVIPEIFIPGVALGLTALVTLISAIYIPKRTK